MKVPYITPLLVKLFTFYLNFLADFLIFFKYFLNDFFFFRKIEGWFSIFKKSIFLNSILIGCIHVFYQVTTSSRQPQWEWYWLWCVGAVSLGSVSQLACFVVFTGKLWGANSDVYKPTETYRRILRKEHSNVERLLI